MKNLMAKFVGMILVGVSVLFMVNRDIGMVTFLVLWVSGWTVYNLGSTGQ